MLGKGELVWAREHLLPDESARELTFLDHDNRTRTIRLPLDDTKLTDDSLVPTLWSHVESGKDRALALDTLHRLQISPRGRLQPRSQLRWMLAAALTVLPGLMTFIVLARLIIES